MNLGQHIYGQVAVAVRVRVRVMVMVTYISHVNPANSDDLGPIADSCYIFGAGFCLLDIAPENTSVCA